MPADPSEAASDRADGARRTRLLNLDIDALVEEHRKLPFGPHSDELARLLTYFRGAETAGKYVVYSESDEEGWVIGRIARRGELPRIDLDRATVYESSALAQHAVFEARVEWLRDRLGEDK